MKLYPIAISSLLLISIPACGDDGGSTSADATNATMTGSDSDSNTTVTGSASDSNTTAASAFTDSGTTGDDATAGDTTDGSTADGSTGGGSTGGGSTDDTSADDTSVGDTTADPGVTGTVVDSGGVSVQLSAGAAFADDGDGGSLRVLLGNFPFDCAAVEDGLGFNTPPGGVWVAFNPLDGDTASLREGDGVQTDQTGVFGFEANATDFGALVAGDVLFDGNNGSADFVVVHCGNLDPFGS